MRVRIGWMHLVRLMIGPHVRDPPMTGPHVKDPLVTSPPIKTPSSGLQRMCECSQHLQRIEHKLDHMESSFTIKLKAIKDLLNIF